MPGLRWPSVLSTETRTAAVRVRSSTIGSMNEMRPSNVSPGWDSTVNVTVCPQRSSGSCDSYACMSSQSLERSATVAIGAPVCT